MKKPLPKAELMRRLRQERKDKGLVKRVAWIKPEDSWRHARYVKQVLKGETGSG